jgi:hypothetical protein
MIGGNSRNFDPKCFSSGDTDFIGRLTRSYILEVTSGPTGLHVPTFGEINIQNGWTKNSRINSCRIKNDVVASEL